MELNRENFEVGSSRTGFAAWVEENPRKLNVCVAMAIGSMGIGLLVAMLFFIPMYDNIVPRDGFWEVLAYIGILNEYSLAFWILIFCLLFGFSVNVINSFFKNPSGKASFYWWAQCSGAKDERYRVEDNFEDYSARRLKEMDSKKQTVNKAVSLFVALDLSVIFALFISCICTFVMLVINDVTAKEVVTEPVKVDELEEIIGRGGYKTGRYNMKFSYADRRMFIKVGENPDNIQQGDTVCVTMRKGIFGFYLLDGYDKVKEKEPQKVLTEDEKNDRMIAKNIKAHLFDVIETTNGRVRVLFYVDDKGQISEVELDKKLHRRVDKALREAIENMGTWNNPVGLKKMGTGRVSLEIVYEQGKPTWMIYKMRAGEERKIDLRDI